MADIQTATWTETASGNSATPPNGMPEGQSAASVNDGVREIMGAIKREYNRSHPTQQSTGTGSAYVLSYTVNPPAWTNGMIFAFRAHADCAAGATCAPGLLTPKVIREAAPFGTSNVRAGSIRTGMTVVVSYDQAADVLMMLTPPARSFATADLGDIKASYAVVAPAGWLFCYGQAVSRTTYAALWAAMGSPNTGDGSTTFNIPDWRGRTLVGRDDMGGSAANRVTNAGSGITGTTLGASGGNQALAQHTHGVSDPGHGHSGTTDEQGFHAHDGVALHDGDHNHTYARMFASGGTPTSGGSLAEGTATTGQSGTHQHTLSIVGAGVHYHNVGVTASFTGISINNSGTGGSANMQPSIVANVLIYAGV